MRHVIHSMSFTRRHLGRATLAAIVLVFAMSGGALAASHYLINSTSQISPKVLRQLKGNGGPVGATGQEGATGRQGAPGQEGNEGAAGKEGATGKEGKEGKEGKQGPQGLAGTARDVGTVSPAAVGPTQFRAEGLRGWQSVTHVGTGEYCLTPDAGVTFANGALVLSLGGSGGGGAGFVVWAGTCDTARFGFTVLTFNDKGELSDGLEFTAVVP
jgi:hypothetical protein